MDLKINTWVAGKYASIFRVAGKIGNRPIKLGQRYPAVWTSPQAGHLHIASNYGANANWWTEVKVPTGEWFKIDKNQTLDLDLDRDKILKTEQK